MQGTTPLLPRSLASQEQGDQLPSSGESIPCTPARDCPRAPARRPWGATRGEKLAPSPGLPLCAEACPRTRSAAIRDDSRDEIPPWRGVWSWNLRHTPPRSLPRSVPRAPRPPRPGGLLPVSKAGDPGFGTLSSPPRAPSRHPSPAAQREVGTISQITFRAPPPQFLSPPERAETPPPGSRGALTDPDDVGHPARVWDPEGAHEEPGPVFPNQTPEAPPGSGHRWAPPSVPGARPWRAPWGGSSRRGRAAAPEAPPGPAARLPSASASRGRPAALRTSYWGAAPPAPAPPRLPPTGRPRARAPGLRPGSARTRLRRLRLVSARLPRGLPTCPGCRAGLHSSPAAPPPAAADAIARARTKPRSGVARAHTLPPSPLPRALPPASRAARRPRSLRVLPRAHTLPTHTRPGAHSRAHTCAGGGEGDPGLGLGGGTPGGWRLSSAAQTSPVYPAAPRARIRAGEPSVERQSWHRKPGDGDSPAAGPAGGNAPAGSGETRSLPSAEPRLSAPTRPELAGRQRQETDPELVSLLISSPRDSGVGPELGGCGAGWRAGDKIQRTVSAGLGGAELQELTRREKPGQTLCVEGKT